MAYQSMVISSGHSKQVRGASCTPNPPYLDEVDEARKVVEQVAAELRDRGVEVVTYHDDVSKTQNENLNRIVDFHNSKKRELDVSVHFNAHQKTTAPVGVECLHLSQETLARQIASAIAMAGPLIDRGPKHRTDLFFLNQTAMPAILIETCFVDSEADAETYRARFNKICVSIANVLGGQEVIGPTPPQGEAAVDQPFARGKCSYFGGPTDQGVSPDEGLAFYSSVEQAPHLFLALQPDGSTGLARRLNPYVDYVACRWNYEQTPKEMLREEIALVRAVKTGVSIKAFPADWGPHQDTGRVADLSPSLMDALGLETDDEVEVFFPYRGDT